MKKFIDYFKKTYGNDWDGIASVSNVDGPFITAMADGIKTLEVSKHEYWCLVRYYQASFPWNWSGKSIWGIRLVVKEEPLGTPLSGKHYPN